MVYQTATLNQNLYYLRLLLRENDEDSTILAVDSRHLGYRIYFLINDHIDITYDVFPPMGFVCLIVSTNLKPQKVPLKAVIQFSGSDILN